MEQAALVAIGSLIGTIAGALLALSGIRQQVQLNQQAAFQVWFQEHYVSKGIEVLHSYVLFVKYNLIGRMEKDKYLLDAVDQEFPVDAINRVFIILSPSELPHAMMIVNSALAPNIPEALLGTYFTFVVRFEGLISRLHRELLEPKVKEPYELHEIIKVSGVNSTLQTINQMTRQALSGPLSIPERVRDA
jgi:hypothetical protein